MSGAKNHSHFGQHPTARARFQHVNGPVPPRIQMHPDGQTSPDAYTSSYGRLHSSGQRSSRGYFNPTPTSYMTPSHQVPGNQVYGGPPTTTAYPTSHMASSGHIYGGPPVADRPQQPSTSSHNGTSPSHLAFPDLPAYFPSPRQRCDSSLTNNTPTPDQSRYPRARSPHTPAPYVTSSMAFHRSSSKPHTVRRQPGIDEDQSFRPAANAMESSKDAASVDVTKHHLKTEESTGGNPTWLSATALSAERLASITEEDQSVQHLEDHRLAAQQQTIDDPMTGQPKADQESASSGPAAESKRSQEDENTSADSLSPISTISDSGEEGHRSELSDADSDEDDKSEGEEHATTPTSESSFDVVDKYAFNFAREGYNHRIPQQLTKGITIHVGSLIAMTTSLKQHREEMEHNTAAVHKDVIPSPIPHSNELQKGKYTIECVWVGMLPSPAALAQIKSKVDQPADDAVGEGSSKKPTRKRVRKTVSVADMREDELKIIGFDRDALRVVAKKSERTTRDTHLYALLNPSKFSKLCQGFKVSFDDVFYFREFRDDTAKSIMPRKQATIAKVRASVFPMDPHPASQSLAPTNAESSAHAEVFMGTPSPPTSTVASKSPTVASQSPTFSGRHAPQNTLSSSRFTRSKIEKEEKKQECKKRKAQHPISNAIIKYRDEERKKSRAEGHYLPLSDVELRKSVENDDPDASADRSNNSNGGLLSVANESFADVDEPVDHVPSAADNMHMDISFEEVDDNAYPEHAVGADDPRFLSHTDDLIKKLARADKVQPKVSKAVNFQGKDGRVIDKNGKVVSPKGRDGNEKGQRLCAAQKESSIVAGKIEELANELAAKQDVAGLQQALTMLQCVESRSGPPKTSALGIYFNVTNSKDIAMKDCAKQLKQLRALFQDLVNDQIIQDHILAWMTKGLQTTGQSIGIELLRPYLIAFAAQYQSNFGDVPAGRINRMSRNVLVDMICRARDEAEEMLRLEAIENGADLASLEADGECPSHPYFNPDEEMVYQPSVWERPGDE